MDSIRRRWSEILAVGLAEFAVATIASLVINEVVKHDLVRDIGIVVVWSAAILGGAALLVARVTTSGFLRRGDTVRLEAVEGSANTAAGGKSDIEFYPDRSSMVKARGGLKKEMEGVYVAWASWYAGTHATAEETFRTTHKPQRLVLLNPDGKYAPSAAKLFRRPLDQFKRDVETTIAKAREAGVEVYLFDGPMTLMLIAEPESRNGRGWVRVEIAIPDSAVRPNFVIKEAGYPELFQEFVAAFKAMVNHHETVSFVGS